ncbi:MAG: hypothetical protein JSW26_09500 [Desulfobacterales bacterium]|nr:MAG: hypothetical protein JSW26_09500 [Desulfobacterales bacterium]
MQYKPDIKTIIKRFEAFWQKDLYDRPPIRIRYPIPGQSDEEWTDACQSTRIYFAYHENVFRHRLELRDDALPSATVDMGPGFMGGVMGCNVRFEHGTTWSEHCLRDWSDLEDLEDHPLNEGNPWIRRLKQTIDDFLEKSTGKCAVGLALPLGPGDIMTALRGPTDICEDFYTSPDALCRLGKICTKAWIAVTQLQLEWIPALEGGYCDNYEIWTPGRTSYFTNDISTLLSAETYRDHLFAFDCQVAETLDTPWMHVHSGGARLIPEFLKIPGLVGIQIVNDRPAGPTLKEILPFVKMVQKDHCLLLRKYSMPELEEIFPELSPQKLYIDTQCGALEEAKRLLEMWDERNW